MPAPSEAAIVRYAVKVGEPSHLSAVAVRCTAWTHFTGFIEIVSYVQNRYIKFAHED